MSIGCFGGQGTFTHLCIHAVKNNAGFLSTGILKEAKVSCSHPACWLYKSFSEDIKSSFLQPSGKATWWIKHFFSVSVKAPQEPKGFYIFAGYEDNKNEATGSIGWPWGSIIWDYLLQALSGYTFTVWFSIVISVFQIYAQTANYSSLYFNDSSNCTYLALGSQKQRAGNLVKQHLA